MTTPNAWTPEEDAELRRLAADPNITQKEAGKINHRGRGAVAHRVVALGIQWIGHTPLGVEWSADDIATLRRLAADDTVSQTKAAEIMGRSTDAISQKTRKLRLSWAGAPHGGPKVKTWNAEQEADAKARWEAGESAMQIAKTFGITRNSAIGRIARMGLKRTKQALKSTPVVSKPKAAPRPPRVAPKPVVAARPAAPVRALEFLPSGSCRWPEGDPRDAGFGYCGAGPVLTRPADGKRLAFVSPYCAKHHAVAYRAAT